MTYGMTTDQAQAMLAGQVYGDQQAMLTGMRTAYGNGAAQMMMGGQVMAGGISGGFNRMFSDLGSIIQPVSYTPQARVETGFYGQQAVQQGFFGSMMGAVGLQRQPWGSGRLEQIEGSTGDFSSRVVSGGAYMASTAGMLAGGFALSPAAAAAGGTAGAAFGAMGSTIGRFAGGMLGGYVVAGMAADTVMEAVQSRRQIQDYLESSSFRFVGAGSSMADPRTGTGMSREARREAADFVRGMDISDPSLNTGELTSILKGADQRGLFVGSGNDIEEFKSKFKSIVENVKLVSKALHQSLEQGLDTIKELRGVGITDSEVRGAMSNAQTLGSATGRTASEMVGLGLQGAEMFRGTGVSMGIGFAGAQMNLSAVRAARDAQVLSQEAISQAGGEEALAMRMTSSGLQFSQSSSGRGFNAGFFDPKTGGLNMQAFGQAAEAGGGAFMENYRRSVNTLSDPADIVRYQAGQEKFISKLGEQFGGLGLQMAQNMAAASQASMMTEMIPGLSQEDAFRFTLKRQGMSATEVDARIATFRSAKDAFKANIAGAERTKTARTIEESQMNNDFYRAGGAIKDYIKGKVDIVAAPINAAMDRGIIAGETFLEENVFGIQRGSFAGVNVDALSDAGSANAGEQRLRAINLDKGGIISRTAGEAMVKLLQSGGLGKAGTGLLEKGAAGESSSQVVLSNATAVGGLLGGTQGFNLTAMLTGSDISSFGMSRENYTAAVKEANRISGAMTGAGEMKESGALKEVLSDVKGDFSGALLRGKLKSGMGIGALVKAVTGQDISDTVPEIIAAVTLEAQSIPSLAGGLEGSRDLLAGVSGGMDAMTVQDMQALRERFETVKQKFSETLGIDRDLGSGVFEQIAASRNYKSQAEKARASGDLREASRLDTLSSGAQGQAMRLQAQSEGAEANLPKIARDMRLFTESKAVGGLTQADIQEGINVGTQMSVLQARRGSSAMGQMIDANLADSSLSVEEKSTVRRINTDLSVGSLKSRRDALIGLSGENAELLSRIGPVGRGIVEQSKALQSMSEKGDQAAVNRAYSTFQKVLATDTLTASGNASGSVGTEGGTAQDDYAKTVSMHVATLRAMEGLARRLQLTP